MPSFFNRSLGLNHSVWECKYHVVFIPKCRRRTLDGQLRQYLGDVFRKLAIQKESRIEEGHLLPDHVHMPIAIPPKDGGHMIDWWMVFANSLWILGLSILLAAFSYHDWLAKETSRRRRELFEEPSWRVPWTAGMFLTCAGWMLSQVNRWWAKALWFSLAAWFGWKLVSVMVTLHKRSGLGRTATGKNGKESTRG